MNSRFDLMEPEQSGADYELEDWNALVDTVCEVFRKSPKRVVSFLRSHDLTMPRHLIAAIWSETHTLEDTTIRCRWKAHKNVYHARERIAELIDSKEEGPRIHQVLALLSKRAPWLIGRAIEAGLVPNPENPENPENHDEKKSENFLAGGLESDTLQTIPTTEPRTTTNPNQ